MLGNIIDAMTIGFALWVYASWLLLSIRLMRLHGAITPLLLVFRVGMEFAVWLFFVIHFGPVSIANWVQKSSAQQAEHVRAMSSLELFRDGISFPQIIGWSILCLLGWQDINGSTKGHRIGGWVFGIIAVGLTLISIRGGIPTISFDPPPGHK